MKHRSVNFEIVNMHAGIYSLLCANVDTFKILYGKKIHDCYECIFSIVTKNSKTTGTFMAFYTCTWYFKIQEIICKYSRSTHYTLV